MVKPIQSSVTVHDQTQLQTVFNYKLIEHDGTKVHTAQRYTVDVFLFFPPQLAINQQTYSKNDFYEDIRPYLRFNAPKLSYKNFIGKEKDPDGRRKYRSPYLEVKKALKFCQEKKDFDLSIAIREVRFFACTFHKFVAERAARKCNYIFITHHNKEICAKELRKASLFLKKSHKLLKRWLLLLNQVKNQKGSGEDLRREVFFAAEYCFFIYLEALTDFGQTLRSIPEDKLIAVFKKKLKAWSRLYHYIARQHGFKIIEKNSTMRELEMFSLRMRSLKRRMWQVLFLHVEQTKAFILRQQVAYMAAAGFAAVWVLIANLFIWRKLQFSGYQAKGAADSFLGMSGMIIGFSLIFAEVLKDRIKEIGRSRFSNGVFRKRGDSNKHIWYNAEDSSRQIVGSIEESTCFLTDNNKLGKEIIKYREKKFGITTNFDEKLIHYQKKIHFKESKLKASSYPLVAVRDIIRLNVNRYVARMDDPTKEFIMMTSMGEVKKIQIPKVYNIDMVLRYTYKDTENEEEKVSIEVKRMILNKNGLVRVEG